MNKHIHRFLLHSVASIFLLQVNILSAEEFISKITDDDYRELCHIYKSVINKPIDLSSKEGELVEKVERKLPVLFEELYSYVVVTDAKERFDLIKGYAKIHKRNWECEPARQYYIRDFYK